MIRWLNGPFGVGKTTTANALVSLIPGAVLFDPEEIGYAIRPTLSKVRPVADFQDWPAWRRLVAAALIEIQLEGCHDIVVPQTVLVESYWDEIMTQLRAAEVEVVAVTLAVDAGEHLRRIHEDVIGHGAEEWRRDRRPDFDAALPWLERKTIVLDTTALTREEVAARLAEFGAPAIVA